MPNDDVPPALQRLPGNIKLLSGTVDGIELILRTAEGITDTRVRRAVPFLGLFWLYVTAMRDILTSRRSDGRWLWNAPALAAVCRPLQEAYIGFFYFGIEETSPEESAFRQLLMRRHSAFKSLDLLERSDTRSESIAQRLPEARAEFEAAQAELANHPFLMTLSSNERRDVLVKRDKCVFEPLQHVWERGGLPAQLYDVLFRWLSQYAHATPYAVDQLRDHRADDEDGAVNMNVPVAVALTCSIKVIEHCANLSPAIDAAIPDAFWKYLRASP